MYCGGAHDTMTPKVRKERVKKQLEEWNKAHPEVWMIIVYASNVLFSVVTHSPYLDRSPIPLRMS